MILNGRANCRPHHRARTSLRCGLLIGLALSVSGCGTFDSAGSGLFGRGGGRAQAQPVSAESATDPANQRERRTFATREQAEEARNRTTLRDLFAGDADPNTTVEVNRYIWTAAQEVLNFLPVEQVDPFTGVLVTGYGAPPGGGRAYRATVYVQDPALDARSLKIALQSRGGGAVAPETVRAVEDAILTRARELRIRDSRL